MKKEANRVIPIEDDAMRAEYDFSSGERGKHYRALQAGYTMTVHEADGTTVVKDVMPREGAVILDPDVKACFPDSKSANSALRCLIPLLSQKKRIKAKKA